MNIQTEPNLQSLPLVDLHKLDVHSAAFWLRLLAVVQFGYKARECAILRKGKDDKHWSLAHRFPQSGRDLSSDAGQLLKLAAQVAETATPVTVALDEQVSLRMIPLQLDPQDVALSLMAVWFRPDDVEVHSSLRSLDAVLSNIVALRSGQVALSEQGDARLDEARVLSLMGDVLQQEKFRTMAHHLCNHLVADLGLERASIGIIKRRKIALQVVSQSAYFDPRSSLARDIEEAMEEACDQECVVQHPDPNDGRVINRMHRQFSSAHGQGAVLTVPFRMETGCFGALFLEKGDTSLSQQDVKYLDQFCQAIAPVFERYYIQDLIWPKRVLKQISKAAAFVLGPTYVAQKAGALTAMAGLAFITFYEMEYRVDATATLRSEDVSIIAAPFDGFLASVQVDLGQNVRQGDVLARLDERELLQEQTIAAADVTRYMREIEKARATKELAAMRIATAQKDQAQAQLNLVEYKLSNATIRAVRDGIVVDGDLKKELGSPVRQGDVLLQVAGTENLYFELAIEQADVHLLQSGDVGQVALVGRPDTRIDFVIERIDPVARSNQAGNQFLAKARYVSQRGPWWRPGMGGTAKIDSGQRTVLWIMTHRTINFLREFFWL